MPEKKKNSSSKKKDIGAEASVDADEMSAEEQEAFNKIMGEIEGGGDSEPSEDDPAAGKEDGTVSEEDFAAELEKVVREAATDSDEGGATEPDAEDGDELDEDQQKAFESIMAQIEGGGDSEASQDEGADEAEDAAVTVENPSDELEKVVTAPEGDAADKSDPSKNEDETADPDEKGETKNDADADTEDALDTEQQEAFESIMAQIEGGKSQEKASEGELEVAQVPQAKPKADDTREAQGETSADIDEILKEVAVEEDEEDASPPKSTDVETASESITTDADHQTAKKEKKKAPETASVSEKEGTVPDEPPASAQPADVKPEPPADITFKPLPSVAAADEPSDKKATALREAGRPAKKRWKKIALGASAAVLLLIGLAGYRYWQTQPVEVLEPESVSSENLAREIATQPEPMPPSLPPEPIQPDQHASDRSSLKTAAEDLDRLRSQLLAKKAEIEELRAYYQAGIDAEINEIIELLKTTNKDSAAMADPRIGLGLSAIQRRDTYIRKLVGPVDELTWNSEELLYFSRRAELLALMASKTSDIDIDGFVRQSRELIDRHSRALKKLNIDDISVSPLSTEAIWNNITKRLPKKSAKAAVAAPKTDNDLISEQICNGNYSQKHKLTVLTPKTARCLAQWEGKDLFLNELKQLDPESARQLAAWKGEWLGLNGLEELSPEAAAYLSRWEGKGLSLNGLSRLSPRVVAILSEWQGDQIELVNVKHMAHWENPKTRLFLSEEMNRKHRAAKD